MLLSGQSTEGGEPLSPFCAKGTALARGHPAVTPPAPFPRPLSPQPMLVPGALLAQIQYSTSPFFCFTQFLPAQLSIPSTSRRTAAQPQARGHGSERHPDSRTLQTRCRVAGHLGRDPPPPGSCRFKSCEAAAPARPPGPIGAVMQRARPAPRPPLPLRLSGKQRRRRARPHPAPPPPGEALPGAAAPPLPSHSVPAPQGGVRGAGPVPPRAFGGPWRLRGSGVP